MGADLLGTLGEQVDQLRRHLSRLQAGEPQAKIALQGRQPADQGRQVDRTEISSFLPIVAEVDPRQHQFPVAVANKLPGLGEHVRHRAAGKRGPDAGDNAEGALHAAAVLHLDISPVLPAKPRYAPGQEKGPVPLCARHRAPTEGWSGGHRPKVGPGKWGLSPFPVRPVPAGSAAPGAAACRSPRRPRPAARRRPGDPGSHSSPSR